MTVMMFMREEHAAWHSPDLQQRHCIEVLLVAQLVAVSSSGRRLSHRRGRAASVAVEAAAATAAVVRTSSRRLYRRRGDVAVGLGFLMMMALLTVTTCRKEIQRGFVTA